MLLAAYCLLLAACCALRTAHSALRTAHCVLFTAYCSRLTALQAYWRGALAAGVRGTLTVDTCDARAAPFYPVMQRALPALEQRGVGPREEAGQKHIVVAADVHDDLGNQAREVSAMLEGMVDRSAGLGLTFYQAVDDDPEAPRAGLRAEQTGLGDGAGSGGDAAGHDAKRPRRAAVANRRRLQGVQWCVDAGLLLSTAEWRASLSELIRSSCRRRGGTGGSLGDSVRDGSVGGDGGDSGGGAGGCLGSYSSYAGGYGEHASTYHSAVGLASSHSDELALHEFLLEGRCRSTQRHTSRPAPLSTPPLPTPPLPTPAAPGAAPGDAALPPTSPPPTQSPPPPPSPPPAAAPEEWLRDGSALLGRRVARRFGKLVAHGSVVAWLPANVEAGDAALYRVVHDDGDVEDLEEEEVEEGTSLCEEQEGRAWLLEYVRGSTVLRSHVLCCRAPARPLPPLSQASQSSEVEGRHAKHATPFRDTASTHVVFMFMFMYSLPAPGAARALGGVCAQLRRPAARQGRGRPGRADSRGRGRLRTARLRVHAGRVGESGVGSPLGRLRMRSAREPDGSARGGAGRMR